ncbi:AcrR family transcriptional regulator [Nocardioides ginsengisegetis]|uniref:AcrR family transcriptional regulator n=1 Tax=Nocardioides ginsengisegetis TaxID=661491 RepID=A0A7W3PAL9_9ACTN|nr:TetR/AcrR family transcriptional regulator [Nocardioides ginsengisegetis]MBA8804885.1 AcrR family transcriptional regulator [Nocardioides ginsengisegetis]
MSTARRATSQRWIDLGEQQREAVARAVVDLVSEGRVPLKVAELADRAGITRPTLYKYFPTLGAAVLHTAQTLLAELDQYVRPRLPKHANARELLLARFEVSFRYARSKPEMTRFFSYYDFAFRRSGLSNDENAVRGAISHSAGHPFIDLFKTGQTEGSIDPDLQPDVTFLAMVTSMTGTAQRLLVEDNWTSGTDRRAEGVHQMMIDIWRRKLTPKDAK